MTTQPAKQFGRTPDPVRVLNTLRALTAARGIPACATCVELVQKFEHVALFPEEAAAVAEAAPVRLATFRAGRGCARAALKELNLTATAIPTAPSGAPIWPSGFVGSLAHTNEIAAAVVAPSDRAKWLGLDLETGEPLDGATMVGLVCRPEELFPASEAAAPENLRRGKLIFVVKEAVYKLYSPLAGAFLEFHDLTVSLDEPAGTFRAALANPERPPLDGVRSVTGVFAETDGLIVALTSLD